MPCLSQIDSDGPKDIPGITLSSAYTMYIPVTKLSSGVKIPDVAKIMIAKKFASANKPEFFFFIASTTAPPLSGPKPFPLQKKVCIIIGYIQRTQKLALLVIE